jgi:hypothetical protein
LIGACEVSCILGLYGSCGDHGSRGSCAIVSRSVVRLWFCSGSLLGVICESDGKGGRAWVAGFWRLCEASRAGETLSLLSCHQRAIGRIRPGWVVLRLRIKSQEGLWLCFLDLCQIVWSVFHITYERAHIPNQVVRDL